jgi:pimeloyl-ACP methyl ester carboxylesterase
MSSFFTPWPALEPFGKNLSLPGMDLFYFDLPAPDSGKPLLVLIHGLGDEADSWRHLAPLLNAAGYRVLAPDLPGFGRSAAPSSLRSHVRAITALISGGGGKAVLIGSSMGAAVAELAAIKKPGTISGLILLDGCMPMNGTISKALVRMAMPFASRKWYRAFSKNPAAAWESLYPYYANLDALPSEDKDFLKQRVMDRVNSPTQEQAYFTSLRSMILAGLFRKAYFERGMRNGPGTINLIWGEEDNVMKQSHAEDFLSLRNNIQPGGRLVLIPGAGHLPHQEKPEETAAAILGFIG